MKAFLDDRALATPRPTVACILETAKAEAASRGRVIIEVLLDGHHAPDDLLADPPDRASGHAEIKCVSADPRELVRQSCTEAAAALDSARTAQEECANAIRVGKLDEALPILQEIVQVWDSAQRVVTQGPALLGLTPDAINITHPDGTPRDLRAGISNLARTLAELKGAVAVQDWADLADIVSDDLDAHAETWGNILLRLGDAVTKLPPPRLSDQS